MADLDNSSVKDVQCGVIGGGSMGGGMVKLFSQNGGIVGFYDYEKSAVERLLKECKEDPDVPESAVHGFTSSSSLLSSFAEDKPKVLVLSLPHGSVVDSVIEEIAPHMKEGDVVIDCGNEWWENTERRQKKMAEKGIAWIGCGVSGGYQAARRGPSMSAGGDKEAFEQVRPLLEKWAAKDKEGNICLAHFGPGGSGNYVKMVHNGIEHAQLSILAELYGLLHQQAGLSNDEIADIFEKWDTDGGRLSDNYLIEIGWKGLRFKDGDGTGHVESGIIDVIDDKIVQDVEKTEGTGTWTNSETALRHVAAPAFNASHNLRTTSARKGERLLTADALKLPAGREVDVGDKAKFVETVTKAAEVGIAAAFTQGFALISTVSNDEGWDVKLTECLRIWKAGCIIRSGGYTDFFQPILAKHENLTNPLVIPSIAQELAKNYEALKKVCLVALEADAVAPTLQATLEYLKGYGCKDLPTNHTVMTMDAFGHHNYDIKGEDKPEAKKGAYHTDFIPA